MKFTRTMGFALLLASLAATGCGTDAGGGSGSLSVMTRNLYLGTDVGPVVQALFFGTPMDVVLAATAAWDGVLATDFAFRAQLLAQEIHLHRPALVGVQEAVLWRSQFPSDTFGAATPATKVEFDFLHTLLNELTVAGEHYEILTITTTTDAELPRFRPDLSLEDIRLTDRDAILFRVDAVGPDLQLIETNGDVYTARIIGPGIEITRGWCSVDFVHNGKAGRFVTTHLEADDEGIRVAQANELLAGPLATKKPVVLVGDFNSDANGGISEAAYLALLASGFSDAWLTVGPGTDGFTCCHDPLLVNPTPFSDPLGPYRIDLILMRKISALDIDVLGEDVADRSGGLWPSDHAGVVANVFVD